MKTTSRILFSLLFWATAGTLLAANITSLSGVTLNPVNPAGGQTVTVSWNYSIDNASNNPHYLIVVSNAASTLMNAGTAGQSIVVGDGCAPGAQVNGGCNLGSNVPAGANSYSTSFVVPTGLSPGTYYVIVAMRDYNLYMNPSVTVQQQAYATFTVPLPPPAYTLNKRAEGNTATPQGLILFSVDYTFVNTNNFIISDPIPANTTFVNASPGGGTSAGSVTWNLGNATTQLSGTVWFLAQVNNGTANGTTITNTATGQTTELPAPTNSNSVTVIVGSPAVTLTKSESASSLAAGAAVTYSLVWAATGQNLDWFDSYDNDGSGTSGNAILGYDNSTHYTQIGPGTFTVATDASGNNYLSTNTGGSGNFPLLLRNAPLLDICQGVIVEGDMFVPNGSPGGADATLVMAYNVSGGVTQAYMIAMSLDNGPGNFFLQKNNGGSVTYPVTLPDSSLPVSIQSNIWYTVKGQISYSAGSLTINGKIWQRGTAEPGAWAFTYTDPSPFPCGETWQQGWQSDGTAYSPAGDYYSNLKVFGPGPVFNPVISDAVPSGITYTNSNVAPTTGAPNLSWSAPGTFLAQTSPISWWGVAACPGPIVNQFTLSASNMATTATSNSVTLTMTGCAPTPTPTPVTGCKVLLYYDSETTAAAPGLPMTALVGILQAAGAQVTSMPVSTSTYDPRPDGWGGYTQVWDARFAQSAINYCPAPDYGDYFNSNWQSAAVSYLNNGGNFYLCGENNGFPSRNDSTGNGQFLQTLGVVTASFDSCPTAAGPFNVANDNNGVENLTSTLPPGNPNFFGDVTGGIPLSVMTNPADSFVHTASGWTHANVDRSIVQGWVGASQMPGLTGPAVGRMLMCWDTTMWTSGDYNGPNQATIQTFFTDVYQWLGGTACGTPTPTPTNTPTYTPSPTPTPPITNTPTSSPTPTITYTPTITPTPINTPTFTPSITPTPGLHVWPNPFDPKYAWPGNGNGVLRAYFVPPGATMSYYTLSGELVITLGETSPGHIDWNGFNAKGARVSAGIYYYVIKSGTSTLLSGKVLILMDQ